MSKRKKVLMICLGNTCRSPIAEAIFQNFINNNGLKDQWEVDSASLMNYHTGNPPNKRAIDILEKNGISDYSHKSRIITVADFYKFDWILGMDQYNIMRLEEMKPPDSQAIIQLLGEYDPNKELIIRDPYFDTDNVGFETVYEQCQRSIISFLQIYDDN